MAQFAISFSMIVEADSYKEAYEIQDKMRDQISDLEDVIDIADIDVEYLEGELDEEEETVEDEE